MNTWAKWGLRYGHFGDFFLHRMANLGLIDFKLDKYIKLM